MRVWRRPTVLSRHLSPTSMGCSGSRPSTDLSAYGVAVGVNGSGASAPRAQFANGHANDFCNGITAGNAPGQWISCGEDKKVIVADWHAQRVVTTWCGHDKGVNRVIAAPHVGGALSASRDTTVKLWKANEDTAALTLKKHELSVQAIGLADDGSKALSGSRDYSLCLWDLAAGALVNTVSISRNVVTCLRWVPGEPHLVVQGSEDLRLRLWDVRTLSKPAATIEGKFTYFPLCVDSDGPYVATGSNGFDGVGCEVRVWDRRTMTQLHELRGHEQGVTGVAFLRGSGGGGDTLQQRLVGSGCKDGTVRVWDANTGTCTAQSDIGNGASVTGLAAARADETQQGVRLYASCSEGHVHALAIEGQGLHVVATGAPAE